MTRFVERQGVERVSALTHAKVSCWRESFHAAAVTRVGGERSWISEAVSLSMTIIGPPHLGQDQRSLGPAVEASCSVFGAPPSSWKESGNVVARLRVGTKTELRVRTQPFPSNCHTKRRANASR